MNLLNRDTDYAVRALVHMAGHPRRMATVSDLHPRLEVPRPYLRTILQTLAKAGFLKSFRGKGGGFLLNREPGQIGLVEVIELFQGPLRLADCVFHGKPCANCATCPLRKTIKRIEADALKTLKSMTIASLVDASR